MTDTAPALSGVVTLRSQRLDVLCGIPACRRVKIGEIVKRETAEFFEELTKIGRLHSRPTHGGAEPVVSLVQPQASARIEPDQAGVRLIR